MYTSLAENIAGGNILSLARAISLVENEVPGYEKFLSELKVNDSVKITGITGPPGAGKSTLADKIIGEMVKDGMKVGVLCIDPSSPFNTGALLGDRIRMREWYNHPSVFIRSLAARGSLGGLHPMVFEIADLMRSTGMDHILIETVGVGQSEVEIASLADTTVVVLVPEAGDDIQTMKSGLMEVADIFVVNKGDRPGADGFVHTLRQMLGTNPPVPVIKTTASTGEGIAELTKMIGQHTTNDNHAIKFKTLALRLYQQIKKQRMKDIIADDLERAIIKEYGPDFNLYRFAERYVQRPEK